MYIRFISLEMFITDKGGWDTHHIPSQNSLLPYKEDWAFLLKGKVAMVRKWCWDIAAFWIEDFFRCWSHGTASAPWKIFITRYQGAPFNGGGTSSSSRSWSWPSILSSPTCWEGYLPVWYIADTERSCCLVGWLSQCPQPVGLIIHSDLGMSDITSDQVTNSNMVTGYIS